MRSLGRFAWISLIAGVLLFMAMGRQPRAAQNSNDAAVSRETSGPTFTIDQQSLRSPLTIVAYGDMRFTDPTNVTATNPTARMALVKRIAEEKPDAILLNGDVPWHGGDRKDYQVFQAETQIWRDANLRIFPALGNHEFADCFVSQCLANWWEAFPKFKGRRWYSLRLGTAVYAMAIDSDDSLLPGSDQYRWIQTQIASLPHEIEFVLISMHHPPVADIQTRYNVDHNPRPNEIAFAQLLKTAGTTGRAKFVVAAGHIHNYERFSQDGIVYLVSGGGGAVPYPVDRTPPDQYQSPEFPNYHYVKFVLDGATLRATMYRLKDPNAATWEAKDKFEINAN